MNALRIASPFLVVAVVAACGGSFSVGTDRSADTGGTGSDSGTASGKACAASTECATGFECVFAKADACTATGVCKDTRGLATCAMFSPGCACDGTEINVACQPFDGYVSKPLLHAGTCGAAGDGGSTTCNVTTDCADGFGCLFPEVDACTATGVCKDLRGIATCAAYSAGCACDGSEINVACLPYAGFVTKPLRHAGACVDGG